MPERDPEDLRPQTSRATRARASPVAAVGAAVLAAAVASAVWWYWGRPDPGASAPPPAAQAPQAPAAPTPLPAEAQGPHNPVEVPEPTEQLPALAASDAYVTQALTTLLGTERVGRFLLTEQFVHRAVATVDNLARAQAPSRLWPVQPTPQRFLVAGDAEAPTQAIAPANAARYSAFVAFAEAVPLDAAMALYRRLYPLFQAAYEELGYPGKYFNDRLVAVLDHLLATPTPAGPLQVQLTPVQGEVPSTRPWVRYEFADPQLQALSSGQKLLLRMGPEHAGRLKAVLGELRRRVATGGQGGAAPTPAPAQPTAASGAASPPAGAAPAAKPAGQ